MQSKVHELSHISSCFIYPSALFLPVFFLLHSASVWGTVPFVGSKPQAALWSCENWRLSSFLGLCVWAEYGTYGFVALTGYAMYVFIYTVMHMHLKTVLCWFVFFSAVAFSVKYKANITWQPFQNRPDLHFPFRIHGGKLCDSCMKASVCVFRWHTLSRGRPLGMCSVPTD